MKKIIVTTILLSSLLGGCSIHDSAETNKKNELINSSSKSVNKDSIIQKQVASKKFRKIDVQLVNKTVGNEPFYTKGVISGGSGKIVSVFEEGDALYIRFITEEGITPTTYVPKSRTLRQSKLVNGKWIEKGKALKEVGPNDYMYLYSNAVIDHSDLDGNKYTFSLLDGSNKSSHVMHLTVDDKLNQTETALFHQVATNATDNVLIGNQLVPLNNPKKKTIKHLKNYPFEEGNNGDNYYDEAKKEMVSISFEEGFQITKSNGKVKKYKTSDVNYSATGQNDYILAGSGDTVLTYHNGYEKFVLYDKSKKMKVISTFSFDGNNLEREMIFVTHKANDYTLWKLNVLGTSFDNTNYSLSKYKLIVN